MTTIPESNLVEGKPNDLESAKFTKDKETVDVIQPTAKLIGLTKEQLEQYRNDPFWKTVRYALFIAFWLVWLAMFVGAILIVVMSPKCVDVKWSNKIVSYKIYSLAYKNSNDGKPGVINDGDFMGIKESLGMLKDMGVSAIWPTPILNVHKNVRTPASVVNLEVNEELGGLDKFKDLIKSAHAKDLKMIVDLPLTVATDTKDVKNWLTVNKINTKKANEKGELTVLDLAEEKVQESLIELARKYITWGIDGINLANYGLANEDVKILTEKIRQIAGGEHILIYFENAKTAMNEGNYQIESLVGNEEKGIKELIDRLHKNLDELMKQRKMQKEKEKETLITPKVWSLGSLNPNERRMDELLKDTSLTFDQKEKIVLLFSLVQLSIPSPISILYGEELALLSGKKTDNMKPNLIIYPWNNSTQYTQKGNNNFYPVAQNAATNNYEDQNKRENSALKIFSKIAKLHQQNDFILGDFKRATLKNLEIYLVKRNLEAISNYYGLIVNWNEKDAELDGAALSLEINSKKINIIASTDPSIREMIDLEKKEESKIDQVKISAFGAVAFQSE